MPRSVLNILQVSTADVLGGAESIALNLHNAYRRAGHHAHLAVGRKRTNDSTVHPINRYNNGAAWSNYWWRMHAAMQPRFTKFPFARTLARAVQSLAEPRGLIDRLRGIEDFNFSGSDRVLDLHPNGADIVHCHNLHGNYFNLRALATLSPRVPVVLTLHDAWLLSGHCAHSFDCDRWKNGCGHCPDLTIYPPIRRDATTENWRRKADIFSRCRLRVATPCQWLMDKVRQSILAPAIIEERVIPNGVDRTIFNPGSLQNARSILGLPPDAAIVLFAAQSPRGNPFKDFATLKAAIGRLAEKMRHRRLLFIALGGEGETEHLPNAEIRHVARQCDPRTVANYYRAADIYIHAAKADTFPNTILEALACGRPVVATGVGGIPEQVRSLNSDFEGFDSGSSATGFTVPAGDSEALSEAALTILTRPGLAIKLGRNAAEDARTRFDLAVQTGRYLSWFGQIRQSTDTAEETHLNNRFRHAESDSLTVSA